MNLCPATLSAAVLASLLAAPVGALLGADGKKDEGKIDPGRAPDSARQWFQDAKFGLFIHWGVYSVLGEGEWALNDKKMPLAEYEKLPARFNPTGFDAAEWVSLARRAGQRYITITSKHHDGFCMWGSKETSHDIVEATPYGKDVLLMLSEECKRQGVKLFFYHSHLDWRHPDYFPLGKTGQHSGRPEKGDWGRYLDYLNRQVAELAQPPYEAAGFWFDGWWDRPEADWQLARTYNLIHTHRPEALIGNNHHVDPFPGEDFQMFEQDLPGRNTAGFNRARVSRLPLETCRTMNKSWGYRSDDKAFRPLSQQIRYLVETVGQGANLLLNVGPLPSGKMPAEAVEILEGMGKWLEKSGEAVYGTRPGPWASSRYGYAVRKRERKEGEPWRAYFHLLEPPASGTLVLPEIEGLKAVGLLNGKPLHFTRNAHEVRIPIPEADRDPLDTILTFDFSRDVEGLQLALPLSRVVVEGDRTSLPADLAEATGRIRYSRERSEALSGWSDVQDVIAFRLDVREAGLYEVEAAYSCDAESEGSEVEVACGESRLGFQVNSTGGRSFRTVPLGLLSLPAGRTEVVLRARKKADSSRSILNLRGLTLHRGFRSLFDGKSLAGWGGAVDGYGVEKGVLHSKEKSGGNLYTDREYSDFNFRFEFRLTPGANNGLGIRTPRGTPEKPVDAAYQGMEIQILDDVHPKYRSIEPWQAHGSIYNVVPAKRGHLRPAGEWNVEEVEAQGRKVRVKLNGVTIVDADLDEVKDQKVLDKHPGLRRASGYLGFCGHGDRVDFRNIRLKELGRPKEPGK